MKLISRRDGVRLWTRFSWYKVVSNGSVSWKEKTCLTNWRAVSFIRKTLLHVVRRWWKWYEFESQSIRVTENKTRAIDPLCVATARRAIGIHTSTFVMSPSPSDSATSWPGRWHRSNRCIVLWLLRDGLAQTCAVLYQSQSLSGPNTSSQGVQ